MISRRLAQATAFAISDQAATSVASFIANAILIHYASKTSYGIYVVAMSTLVLIASTVDVLFSLQMTYLTPHHPAQDQKAFCAALRSAQTYTSVALAIVICCVSLVAGACQLISPAMMRMGVIIAAGSLFISWQEYYRSLLFLFDSAGAAFFLGMVQIVVWMSVAAAAIWHLTPLPMNESVLSGYCIGAAVAAAVGYVIAPLPPRPSWSQVRAAAAEAWEQGSWSLLGSIISWLQTQSFAWLLAVLASAAAAAEASFAKLFFAPLGLMLSAVNRVARPTLGKVYAKSGERAAVGQGRQLLMAMIALVAVYCPTILVLKDWVIAKAAVTGYANASALIVAWGVVTAVQVTRWNSTLLLGVLRRNRQMTTVQMVSAAAALVASFAAIPRLGPMGAILSVGIGEAFLSLLMWRQIDLATSIARNSASS